MMLRKKRKKRLECCLHLPSLLGWHIFFYLFSEEEKSPIGKEVLLAFDFCNSDYTLLQQMFISSYSNTCVLWYSLLRNVRYICSIARQLWRFLKAGKKVKHFGSLLSESIYDFGGNFVYLKHSPTVGVYLCPLHLPRSDTLNTYLKQKLPYNTLFYILQKLPLWTNTHTGAWAKICPILKCFYFS